MTNEAYILGLDISSTTIGYVLYNSIVLDRGVIRLGGRNDISERCLAAKNGIENLLMRHVVDAVAIESPVARFAKAVIPQCRISGVILLALAERSAAWCEIAPAEAKRALAGDGDASKEQMLRAAAGQFGYKEDALAYVKVRGDWIALASLGTERAYSEHEADALGVALSASKKVEILHQDAINA